MTCPKCGKENNAESQFCKSCGAPLIQTCPKCGKANKPGSRFCKFCGQALGQAAPAPVPVPPPAAAPQVVPQVIYVQPPVVTPRRGMPGWGWALIAVAAFVVIAVPAFFLLMNLPGGLNLLPVTATVPNQPEPVDIQATADRVVQLTMQAQAQSELAIQQTLTALAPTKSPVPVRTTAQAGYIANLLSGRCIDVQGSSGKTNGLLLQIYDCEFSNASGTDQRWELTSDGYIKSSLSGKCLDVLGSPGRDNGTKLQLLDCEFSNPSGTDQRWEITSDGYIRNLLSGKCIDVTGIGGKANSTKLQLYDCELSNPSGTDQRWTFTNSAVAAAQPAGCAPTVKVAEATNCRAGPGKAYDHVSDFYTSDVATIVGKSADGTYWVVNAPHHSGTCWLWGETAIVTGDTACLPIVEAPTLAPTPKPAYVIDPKMIVSPLNSRQDSLTISAIQLDPNQKYWIWMDLQTSQKSHIAYSCDSVELVPEYMDQYTSYAVMWTTPPCTDDTYVNKWGDLLPGRIYAGDPEYLAIILCDDNKQIVTVYLKLP